MDASPTSLGLNPRLKALPPFRYINFFPSNPPKDTTPEIDWQAHLDTRDFQWKADPSWNRVARTPTDLAGRNRKIVMKLNRLKHHKHQRATVSLPIDTHYKDTQNDFSQPKRVRTSFVLPRGIIVFAPNTTETASHMVYALSLGHVVKQISDEPHESFKLNPKNILFGGLDAIPRRKHRIDGAEAPCPPASFYRNLLKSVVQYWVHNRSELEMSSLIHQMALLEAPRRDVRLLIANAGMPDLTDIDEATEPASEDYMSATSAHKTQAPLHSAPSADHHSEPKLVDGTPKAAKQGAFSTPTQATIGAANATLPADYALCPGKTFKVPSDFTDTATEASLPANKDGGAVDVPSIRPEAPTPTRWEQGAPSTPRQWVGSRVESPTPNELGLLAAIPKDCTPPQPTPPWKQWTDSPQKGVAFDISDFSFGEQQPDDQSSVLNKSARRKSEPPILQSILKESNKRRRSMSPQKPFAGNDHFDDGSAAEAAAPVTSAREHNTVGHAHSTPTDNDDADAGLPPYLRKHTEPLFLDDTKTPAKPSGTYNIDMRHTIDIFGAPASSALKADSRRTSRVVFNDNTVKVEELANMAEDRCGGDAKVFITQEGGKMVVRFKLPAKYAHMFPQSQGFDDSSFSLTPSAVSHSPRVTFKGREQSPCAADSPASTAGPGEPMSLDMASELITESPIAPTTTTQDDQASTLSELDPTPKVETLDSAETNQAPSTPTPSTPTASARRAAPYTPMRRSSPLKQVHFPPESPILETIPCSVYPTKAVNLAPPTPTRVTRSASPKKTATALGTVEPSPMRVTRSRSISPKKHVEGAGFSDTSCATSTPSHTASPLKKLRIAQDDNDTTLVVSDFEHSNMDRGLSDHSPASTYEDQNTPGDTSSLLNTPTMQLQREALEAPSSSLISDLSFEPSFQTPTYGYIDFSPSRAVNATPTPAATTTAATPDNQSPETNAEARNTSPPLITSFTPVNKTTPRATSSSPAAATQKDDDQAAKQEVSQQTDVAAPAATYNDSPNRDYLYAFISRSKPKRPATTDAGSPVAISTARQPLGTKSPNTGSPSPVTKKRKYEEDIREQGSPLKAKEEPAPKKARTVLKAGKRSGPEPMKTISKSAGTKLTPITPVAARKAEAAEEPRRSTRIRKQPVETIPVASKSSIPTSIKLNRGVAGAQVLNSAVRNEQAELSRQTSVNTKKNKFDADSVQETLARCSEERSGEDSDEPEAASKPSKRGNNVGWKTPLESFQQSPAKKAKVATKVIPKPTSKVPAKSTPKPKATLGNSGIAKPKPKAAAPKSRISQAAKNLGMAGNGTPAKRMTRARARET